MITKQHMMPRCSAAVVFSTLILSTLIYSTTAQSVTLTTTSNDPFGTILTGEFTTSDSEKWTLHWGYDRKWYNAALYLPAHRLQHVNLTGASNSFSTAPSTGSPPRASRPRSLKSVESVSAHHSVTCGLLSGPMSSTLLWRWRSTGTCKWRTVEHLAIFESTPAT